MSNIAGITKQSGFPIALGALTVSIFAIGTTEVVMIGLLTTIAQDLSVSISQAGWIVTSYAIGVAIGGPLVTALTSYISRKKLLLAITILFIVSNAIAAFSTGFIVLIIGRILSGIAHGVFVGIGANIASSLVSEEKRATAIAVMFTGLTVAMVTGVPIGTYIGQHFGWRFTFGGIAVIGLICLIANFFLLPNRIKMGIPIGIKNLLKVMSNKSMLLGFSLTLFSFAGLFGTFTYLSPLLQKISLFSNDSITPILFLYGLAVACGNIIGGKLANKNPVKTLSLLFVALSLVVLCLYFTIPYKTFVIITIAAMGFSGFATVPGMQLYVIKLSEKHLKGMEDVSSVLNIAAFNVGIALGSYLGGIIISSSSSGLKFIPIMSAAFVAIAIVISIVSNKIENQKP